MKAFFIILSLCSLLLIVGEDYDFATKPVLLEKRLTSHSKIPSFPIDTATKIVVSPKTTSKAAFITSSLCMLIVLGIRPAIFYRKRNHLWEKVSEDEER